MLASKSECLEYADIQSDVSLAIWKNEADRVLTHNKHLHTHIDQDIRLEQLADVACLSTYHFSHMFKQSTGLSPYQFLLRQRMTLATTELRHATPIALVAEHCGYSNASRFTRAFKGAFGVTPKAYQQAWW